MCEPIDQYVNSSGPAPSASLPELCPMPSPCAQSPIEQIPMLELNLMETSILRRFIIDEDGVQMYHAGSKLAAHRLRTNEQRT